jgi:hypothetical protein
MRKRMIHAVNILPELRNRLSMAAEPRNKSKI